MLNFSKWKIGWIAFVCLMGVITAFPNFLSKEQAENLPAFLPSSQVNLGLDLQGGSHLLLEAKVEVAVQDRLNDIQDDVRSALRSARIRSTGYQQKLTEDEAKFTFRLREEGDREQVLELIEKLAQPIINQALIAPVMNISASILNDGRVEVVMSQEGLAQLRHNVVQQSIEVVRKRIDEMGTREPTIQRQGADRILVQVPGLQDPQRLKDLLGRTARLTFQLVDETVSSFDIEEGRIPPGTEVLPYPEGGIMMAVRKRAIITGENLKKSQVSTDQFGAPAVGFTFDAAGARKFGDVTRKNVGKVFAVILDGEIISAPRIDEPILSGSGIIRGSYTFQTANDLVVLLNAGAAPVPLETVEERTVGPIGGAEQVEAGKKAAVIGLLAVVVFIILSYGGFGVAANLALMFNLAMIFGALSVFQITLTLPGIAGIVLTIGMAVDANVLVFERIREEVRIGKPPLAAVDNGYTQALSTILDANITTLIAAVILFQFGSGPIKGFAVTLGIGIITSVFTAVTVTRLFVTMWLRRTRPEKIEI